MGSERAARHSPAAAGRSIRVVAAMALLAALSVVSPATATLGPLQEPPTEDRPIEPRLVGADAILSLPAHFGDERAVRRAVLAQFEQQGLLPPGWTQRVADAPTVPAAPPDSLYRDLHLVCDLDGDGLQDIVSNDYNPPTLRSVFRAINGSNGKPLWEKDNFHFFLGFGGRGGSPDPIVAENFAATPDLDGDGVCDFLGFGFVMDGIGALFATVLTFEITVHAVSGRTGADLWAKTYSPSAWVIATLPFDFGFVFAIKDFPNGFHAFQSPSGPRFLFKTIDVYWVLARDQVLTSYEAEAVYVTDHVYLRDARTGEDVWRRDLEFSTNAAVTNFTWITGVADLGGDHEPEILLDQYYLHTPRTTEITHPITGDPLFKYGQGIVQLALRGDTGLDHWRTLVYDENAVRPNVEQEENFERLRWTRAQVLPDANGDGVADVLASYLTQEFNEFTTVNGAFRTYFVPLDGATGRKLWAGDVRYQGWGFAAGMNPDETSVPFLAVGTVDVPTQTPPAGRFPPKDVRLAVLEMEGGEPVWSYMERFAQDSYLAYDLALHQYLTTLAPHDWDGDGLKDLVTPSQYVPPREAIQVLLATATHTYEVRSGATGEVLRRISAWGTNGFIVACAGAEAELTVISGHARRLDATRFDGDTGERLWRRPLWNDPTPQAGTAGVLLRALAARCGDTDETRTMFGVNFRAESIRRGSENVPLFGFVRADGSPHWQLPLLRGNPPLDPTLGLENIGRPHATSPDLVVLNLGPGLLGLASGLGFGFLRTRARRKEGST